MAQKQAVEVVVAQQKIVLRTAEDPARVLEAAEMVNRHLREVLRGDQPVSQQVLILVAMNLADKLIKRDESIIDLKGEVKKRSMSILSQMEREFPL